MLDKLQPHILPVLAIGQLLLTILVLFFKNIFARKNDHEDLKNDLQKLETRVIAVEHEIEHLPDKDTATKLLLEIANLNGKLEAYEERISSVNQLYGRMQSQMDRMDNYLRNMDAKK